MPFFPVGCGDEFRILLDTPNPPRKIFWVEADKTINVVKTDGTDRRTVLAVSGTPSDIALHVPQR